jgi:hypothetical protein
VSLEGLKCFAGCEEAFLREGFAVRRFPEYLRLVKDHCEVQVTQSPKGTSLKVPVLRAYTGESFPPRLLSYLEERNVSPKGPGAFVVEDNVIWCVCELAPGDGSPDGLARAASSLVAQVERLGPKILNLR